MICRNCGSCQLEAEPLLENEREIRDGNIVCSNCNVSYKINDGILLLEPERLNLSKMVSSEKMLQENVGLDDEWLLSLPYPPIDFETSYEFKGGDKAINFEQIWKIMGLEGRESVLELGAGTCWVMNRFVASGCRGVACDVVLRKYYGLRSAEVFLYHEKGKKNYFDRIQMGFGQLPFRDSNFDIVFIQSALQFTNDLNETFREISRVLKPGGKLVLLYQGVSGIFKKHEAEGKEQSVLEYLNILRSIGMKTKLIFPASIVYHMENKMSNARKFNLMGTVFSFFWHYIPFIKKIILNYGVLPMTILFGVPVSAIAIKPIDS